MEMESCPVVTWRLRLRSTSRSSTVLLLLHESIVKDGTLATSVK